MAAKVKGATNISIGWIHPGMVTGDFALSLAHTIQHDNGRRNISQLLGCESSPRVSEGRSQLVDGFLEHGAADWLLMIDSDMGWQYRDFELLCEHADKDRVPIIGGLCFGGGRSVGLFPTIYKLQEHPEHGWEIEREPNYPRDTLVRVGGTGAAFLMVHRRVYNRMGNAFAKDAQGHPNPFPWFMETIHNGRPMGEDMTFCIRAQTIGFPIYVHTGVKVTHMKQHRLTESLYDEMRLLERLKADAGISDGTQ